MEDKPWEYDILVKILVVGDSSVGKSCLLLRYADNNFTDSHCATIGVDFKLKTEQIDGKKTKIQIWDTAGQERFRTITASYYRGAHGILLVYDVTNEASFNSISQWLKDVQQYASEHVSIVLVGNKADLNHKRQVSTEQGKELAKELGLEFFETSAKTSENVNSSFEKMIRNVIQKQNYLKNNLGGKQTVDGPKNINKLEEGGNAPPSTGCCG
jgi:Ras-related protein Rab-8A